MNRVQARDLVVVEFSDLADGHTAAGEMCPSCNGGDSRESSLSVTRSKNRLLFTCHRASCGFHGAADISGRYRPEVYSNKKEHRYPKVPAVGINEYMLRLIANKYGVPTKQLEAAGLQWSGDGDGFYNKRVVFPIYDFDGKERGRNYRSYIEKVKPKAVVELKSPDAIKASWYRWKKHSPTLVVVEDQMSAIKLAKHTHTLALLGTNLSDGVVEEIRKAGYKKVLLSLDNDATWNAIILQIRHKNDIPGLLVASLAKDIKDMDREDLEGYVNNHLVEETINE